MPSNNLNQPETLAYMVCGISAGKHVIKAIKPMQAEWGIDDAGLGEYWAGNEPLIRLADFNNQVSLLVKSNQEKQQVIDNQRVFYEQVTEALDLPELSGKPVDRIYALTEQLNSLQNKNNAGITIPLDRLQNWLDLIHDNERSMGDRLQSLSATFASLLRGEAVDKYPLRIIREQKP